MSRKPDITARTSNANLPYVNGSSTAIVTATLNTNDFVLGQNVSVYPNPANYILNIRLDNANTALKSVQLYDVTGKRVFNSNTASTIDVSNFYRGLYILKVVAENGSELNKKIIVE